MTTRALLALILTAASITAAAQDLEYDNEADSIEMARTEACSMVAGTWQYSKPYVHAQGTTLLGKLGKPIAKSKLKKKLDKAYKKLKINKGWSYMILEPDGTWQMKIIGVTLSGKYTYDPANESLSLKYHGVPLKSHAHRDGDKLYLAFDADRLIAILRIVGSISHSNSLKAISTLANNYSNVMLGFEMKSAVTKQANN